MKNISLYVQICEVKHEWYNLYGFILNMHQMNQSIYSVFV